MIHQILCVAAIIGISINCVANNPDFTSYVNPFIGTQGDGNTFPGAALPFGMVKLGPDCGDLQSNSGYRHDGGVKGFSHTHVSGTGGGCKYGNILVAPFTSALPEPGKQFNRLTENAYPGYYTTTLENNVKAELTVTPHAAIHRYTFGENNPRGLFIESGSILGRYYGCGEAQNLIYSEIEVISPTEIAGLSRQDGGWNIGDAYTVYFYAISNQPAISSGCWIEGNEPEPMCDRKMGKGKSTGAFLSFDSTIDEPLELRVGISYVSIAQARDNCLKETSDRSFEDVADDAKSTWNNYLQRIRIDSDKPDELIKFYTALYHTFLQPTDKTGENPLWDSPLPYYDDFYCLWDTFRTNHPLFTLIAPEKEAEIVSSLIDIYIHEGYMPDGRSGDSNGRTQGGSNADMIVAEAILKGLEGFDTELAMEAMLKDAEANPGNAARRHGRGGIEDYKNLGYISTDYERSGVRTLEYAANDYSISLAAEKLGLTELAAKYRERAMNWKNLWRDISYDGITGFIMPRKSSGEWDDDYRDPTWDYYVNTPEHRLDITPYREIPSSSRVSEPFSAWSGGSWVNIFYESNSWEYSFYVPQDIAGLIDKCGGTEAFTNRLDHFFDKGHYNINNEPGFLVPCLYIYSGRHDKAIERIDKLLKEHYTAEPNGLPGNDDSGAMSSWYVFHSIGLFPIAGQDVYLITAPHYKHTELTVPGNNKVTINAKNFKEDNIYVQSVKVNGKPWRKPWIRHSELTPGTNIEFVMGKHPSQWFTEVPPSM